MSPPRGQVTAPPEVDLSAFILDRLVEDERAAEVAFRRMQATARHRAAVVVLHSPGLDGRCPTCVDQPWPCLTLRHMAATWPDHPAYHPDWTP